MAVFAAVADEAGFAAAARRLNMSAPAVTRAVSALEARLGARLLHRTTRTVRLTEAGQRYLSDCRRILAEIEEADANAAGIHGTPSGRVTVTASVLFGRMVLAPHLLGFLARHPDVSTEALFVDRVVNLMEEGLDVAVRIAELPDSSLVAARVGAVRRVLCAAPDYLAARGTPRSPRDLDDHDTIDFANMTPHGEWAFRSAGRAVVVRPRSRLRVNNADVAIGAACAGHGITRLLSYMIAPELARGDLTLVLDDHAPPPVPVHVVHKETGHVSARVRALFDHLVTSLRQDPGIRGRESGEGDRGPGRHATEAGSG